MNVKIDTVATPHGEVTTFKLTNAMGASVTLSTVGAGIVGIEVPDRNGVLADVTLGYRDLGEYFYDGPCAGKTPGRYANRIAQGRFTLDGVEHRLAINNGPNHLHGGPEGFSHKNWQGECQGDDTVVFTLSSPDGDENYPGNVEARVIYTWTEDNVLKIELWAITDAPTVINLTNHTYFNLAGEGSGTVLDHTLQLAADKWLPTSDSLIPTGEMAPVAGTPMDFLEPKKLGRDIKADFDALRFGKGYDNCWVLDAEGTGDLIEAAELVDEKSGRVLRVFTDQPAVQVYTGNWLAGAPVSKSGREYQDYDGVAIECQGMPDAPNHDNFPSQVLQPDDEYRRVILFAFETTN